MFGSQYGWTVADTFDLTMEELTMIQEHMVKRLQGQAPKDSKKGAKGAKGTNKKWGKPAGSGSAPKLQDALGTLADKVVEEG